MNSADFEVLRKPFISGRQSPSKLGSILPLAAVAQAGLYALQYWVTSALTVHPNKDEILQWHFWVTAILVVLSIIYSIPAIYRKFEKGQYLISILASQNIFAVNGYLIALFILGLEGTGITPQRLVTITWITLGMGVVVFLLTAFRFWRKLKKGDYREGTAADHARENLEYRSYMPIAVAAGLGIVFTMQSYIRLTGLGSLNEMTAIVLGLAVFYVMLFVLPEQLVILYCKYRFQEFNFFGRPIPNSPDHFIRRP